MLSRHECSCFEKIRFGAEDAPRILRTVEKEEFLHDEGLTILPRRI